MVVGGNARRRIQVPGTESVNDRPIEKESSDVEARAATMGSGSQAPIKIVDGCLWSPGVNRLLCLLGKTSVGGSVHWNLSFLSNNL